MSAIYVQKVNVVTQRKYTHLYIYSNNIAKGFVLDYYAELRILVAVEVLQAFYPCKLNSWVSSWDDWTGNDLIYVINKTEYQERIKSVSYADKSVIAEEVVVLGEGKQIIRRIPEPKHLVGSVEANKLIADLLVHLNNKCGFLDLFLDLQLR